MLHLAPAALGRFAELPDIARQVCRSLGIASELCRGSAKEMNERVCTKKERYEGQEVGVMRSWSGSGGYKMAGCAMTGDKRGTKFPNAPGWLLARSISRIELRMGTKPWEGRHIGEFACAKMDVVPGFGFCA